MTEQLPGWNGRDDDMTEIGEEKKVEESEEKDREGNG